VRGVGPEPSFEASGQGANAAPKGGPEDVLQSLWENMHPLLPHNVDIGPGSLIGAPAVLPPEPEKEILAAPSTRITRPAPPSAPSSARPQVLGDESESMMRWSFQPPSATTRKLRRGAVTFTKQKAQPMIWQILLLDRGRDNIRARYWITYLHTS